MDEFSLSPLGALMRRYSFAYVATHDFSICPDIFVEDFALMMGDDTIRGLAEQYIPACARQYRQFPGLGFTVHEVLLGTDLAAVRFTEHGRSVTHDAGASWSGIGLYRWNGRRLVEGRVEEDFYARREQQTPGLTHPIRPPALDPWTAAAQAPDDGVEEAARAWLCAGGLATAPVGHLDDEHAAPARRPRWDEATVHVLELFGVGSRVAFHVRTAGRYAGGLPGLDEYRGTSAHLYATGIVEVADGRVTEVRAVSDRLAAERRLRSANAGIRAPDPASESAPDHTSAEDNRRPTRRRNP